MKKCKSKIVLLSLGSIFTFTNCTSTRVASLTKSDNEVLDMYTTKIPDKNYLEIAYIQTDGGIFHTPQKLLVGLKKKAIEMKADALINIKYDFQAFYPVVSATAIKYKDKN